MLLKLKIKSQMKQSVLPTWEDFFKDYFKIHLKTFVAWFNTLLESLRCCRIKAESAPKIETCKLRSLIRTSYLIVQAKPLLIREELLFSKSLIYFLWFFPLCICMYNTVVVSDINFFLINNCKFIGDRDDLLSFTLSVLALW